MKKTNVEKPILVTTAEFKTFWKEKGPFAYALTSNEFPPILLEPEQWLFSNDLTALIKALIQFDARKMKFVKAGFNPKNKSILRPESLSEWKISNFPEELNTARSEYFIPEGHITCAVLSLLEENADAAAVEGAFFKCFASEIADMGYLLFSPAEGKKRAAGLNAYLNEWEEDEKEAGLF